MIIAFDIDKTWTLDPNGWTQVANLLTHRGHLIYIVTGRSPPMESDELDRMRLTPFADLGRIIYTCGELKEVAMERIGVKVDVWIDNEPGTIQRCKIIQEPKDEEL